MATHKSAIKRQKQAEKKHEINKSVKSMLKTLAKKVEQAVEAKNADVAKDAMVKAMKAYDKAPQQGSSTRAPLPARSPAFRSRSSKISAA